MIVEVRPMKFCRLCGKNRPAEEFTNVPLARFQSGRVLALETCQDCGVIIHNVRQLVGDAEQADIERMKKEAQEIQAKKEGLIVVPQLRMPKNLRS